MHIKKIVICGFKSYREKTVVDEIHEGFNIVVGRNGSGKSNLFAAIEFALTLEYRNMRAVERSALLHQGAKNQDPAYVEIVFDNSDKKLPWDEDEVTFRRMLATKKDKFFVNGKELSNARQFLDMAGFTNPYFIVKQGKVHQLAIGNDAFRLKLLEDVAGSTSYDEKIADCTKNLKAAETKKAEVKEFLKRLDERKKTLESEASELQNFIKIDQIRRAMEYVLNDRENEAVKNQIDKCLVQREKLTEDQSPYKLRLGELTSQLEKVQKQISTIKGNTKLAQDKKESAEAEVLILVAEKEKLKNKKVDIERKQSEDSLGENNSSGEVQKLNKELKKMEAKLQITLKDSEAAKKEEDNVQNEFIKLETNLMAIEARLQRSTFASVADRNKHLNKEIKMVNEQIKEKNATVTNLFANSQNLETQKIKLMANRETIKEELDDVRTELTKLEQASGHPEAQLFNSRKKRSEMWRSINEIDQDLNTQKEVFFNNIEQLNKRAGRPAMKGWEGVRKVLETFRDRGDLNVLEGYHGLVIEKIRCEKDLDQAVEAAAGVKLFHHVVNNHQISKKIMKEFNKQKFPGEVSFIPLEEIILRSVKLPEDQRNVRPLLANIQYSPEIEKVACFIFGRTLVSISLADAVSASKLYKLNCVTLEGDKVDHAGPITGGYIQTSTGKLELYRIKEKSELKLKDLSKERIDIETTLAVLEKDIEEVAKKTEQFESKKCRLRSQKEKLTCELKAVLEKLICLELKLGQEKKNIDLQNRHQFELDCKKKALEKEMLEDLSSSSQEERRGFQELRKKIKTLHYQRGEKVANTRKKEGNILNIKQRIHQLNEMLEEEKNRRVDQESTHDQLNRLTEILQAISEVKDQLSMKKKEIEAISNEMPQLNKMLKEKSVEMMSIGEQKHQIEMKLLVISKDLESIMTLHLSFLKKLEKIIEAGQKIGSVPSGITKYLKTKSKDLYEKLKKINVDLKDKDGLNQKATEQYTEILESYQEFTTRLQTLEDHFEYLKELLEDLEAKKGEAVLNNFRVLQEQFKEIFTKIVPLGNAELVLYGEDFEINQKTWNNIDPVREVAGKNGFQGMKINVNFVNKTMKDMRNLLQLSGGQKSVVALSLILAIQKIDPVPFYLFDEVDQALDPIYRESVAKVIYDLARDCELQFICTTFRREFLVGAQKLYGVAFNNRCSSVRIISQLDALDFVENESGSESTGTGSDAVTGSSDDSPEADGTLIQ